ncbi:hypothetical protein ANANG_G00043660 [Anguilla anguilla]|uniref:Uncharacterized protein n=1 Tax=Anguilla anguilla TaxID=7936 RepID=A0A9D3MU17_ANGAN|nr:hypothetical protein ANANG_G00043660 [Anguilla anguilla]
MPTSLCRRADGASVSHGEALQVAPPPPPRRSFPSSHGLTTNRSGEVIVTSKTIKKSESEETETQKPHVKLRRTVSEAPRPASTPPVIAASGVKEDDDEEKIIAELEVFQRAPIRVKVSPPHSLPSTLRRTSTPPSSLDLWPSGATGRKSEGTEQLRTPNGYKGGRHSLLRAIVETNSRDRHDFD